jgi:hypothetical protein
MMYDVYDVMKPLRGGIKKIKWIKRFYRAKRIYPVAKQLYRAKHIYPSLLIINC